MAPVILATVVHCADCGKKIGKALKRVPGVDSVWVSVETGLVSVEGTADAATLQARLRDKWGMTLTIVSDGTAVGASASPPRRPAPPPPEQAPALETVLEMDLHCESCAAKVEKAAMKIPGVETATTDVAAGRLVVTGTADASRVAATIRSKTRRSVTVVNDPGYEHDEGNDVEPAPPPAQKYGIPPPPEAAYYYYPSGQGGGYGFQDWTAPSYQPTRGYYDYPAQGEVYGGQQWTTPYPTTSRGYYNSEGPPGDFVYDQYQQDRDEKAGSDCRIQ